jgi:hypothetical protein
MFNKKIILNHSHYFWDRPCILVATVFKHEHQKTTPFRLLSTLVGIRHVVTAVAVMAMHVRRSTQLTGRIKYAHALKKNSLNANISLNLSSES